MKHPSARAVARQLFGGERVGDFAVIDVRASSGIRVTMSAGAERRAVTLVIQPAGRPAFVSTPRVSVSLVGTAENDAERALVREITARVRANERTFAAGELERIVDDAARKLAPVPNEVGVGRPMAPREAEIRLNLVCNQRCFFCNCDGNAPNVIPARAAAVEAAERFVRMGARTIVITGGEPTLNAALDDVARAARDAGADRVMVQTNAVALAEEGRADALRRAGVDTLFVSLHSMRADVSDRITGSPGTHAQTLRGIDAALAADLAIVTNFVITAQNFDEPAAYVRWLRGKWPAIAGRVFSFMAPVAAGIRNIEQMPRISDALPSLRAALDDCVAHGERVRVAGVCGLPLCTMRGHEELCDEWQNPDGIALAPDRVKPAACAECVYASKCSGAWRRYVERYGDAELVPVRERREAP